MGLVIINYAAKINSRPSQSGWNKVIIPYNTSYTFSEADFTTDTTPEYSDPEGDAAEAIKIISLPSLGSLTLSSFPVNINDEINTTSIDSGNLVYTPVNNTSGYTDSDFEFTISDVGSGLFTLNSNPIILEVGSEVNNPPSSVGSLTLQIDNRSSHTFTLDNFTTETTPAYSDPEGDSASTLRINSLPLNGVIFLNGSAVTSTGFNIDLNSEVSLGNLIYQSNQSTDSAYSDSFNFSIADSGSGEFTLGGVMTIDVLAFVNQPPTTSDNTINDEEGDVYTFSMSDFPSSDPEMDSIVALRFPTLPGSGSIKLSNVDVTINQEISSNDVNSNLLTYTQGPNAGGTQVQFTFQVKDSNGNWSN